MTTLLSPNDESATVDALQAIDDLDSLIGYEAALPYLVAAPAGSTETSVLWPSPAA